MRRGEADSFAPSRDGEEIGARNVGRFGRRAGFGKRAEQALGLALDVGRGAAGFRLARAH